MVLKWLEFFQAWGMRLIFRHPQSGVVRRSSGMPQMVFWWRVPIRARTVMLQVTDF
jgi:hypothetical protein